MIKSVLFAALCAMTSVACEISCWDNCDDDWSSESKDQHNVGGGSHASGGRSGTGSEPDGSAACDTGGTASTPATGGQSAPAPTACAKESDCRPGFNCDYQRKECVAAGAETCSELLTETDCDNRKDCVSNYAGTNCSCGPECTCVGGEPGCVCESFAFFKCEILEG